MADENETSLKTALKNNGLDADHWLGKLKTEVGVTKYVQIKYLGLPEFKILKKCARYPWEVNAIKKFLEIPTEDEDSFNKKTKEQLISRGKDAEKLLTDLRKMKDEGKKETDRLVEGKKEELKAFLNIEGDHWKHIYKDVSLNDTISRLSSFLSDSEKLITTRKSLTTTEVVENASGGRVLKGILIKESSFDICKTVIEIPKELKLKASSMNQVDEVSEFSSQCQHDSFDRSLKTLGYSMATRVKDSGWGFHLEGGHSMKHSEERRRESQMNYRKVFQSRVMHSFVPMASMDLRAFELQLAIPAIAELKRLDKLIETKSAEEAIMDGCQKFIQEFGSHVSTSSIHFGGIYESSAVYSSEQDSQSQSIKEMIHDAHSAYLEMGYKGFAFEAGGSFSGDYVKGAGNITKSYDMSELKKVNLKIEKIGGPQEATTFPLWRAGLEMNETWKVIDCGNDIKKDFTGIWKLISNHRSQFKNNTKLSNRLKEAWHKLNGMTDSDSANYELAVTAIEDGNELVDKITSWLKEEDLEKKAAHYMELISSEIEDICSKSGSNEYFVYLLKHNRVISDFFLRIVNLEKMYAPEDIELLKYIMKKLLQRAVDVNYPEKNALVGWVSYEEDTKYVPGILSKGTLFDIPSLLNGINEILMPEQYSRLGKRTVSPNKAKKPVLDIKGNLDLALAVEHVKVKLHDSRDICQVFLLELVFSPLKYSFRYKNFQSPVSFEDLELFTTKLEDDWITYEKKRTMGRVRLQAFLLCLAGERTLWNKSLLMQEKQFTDVIKTIQNHLEPELKSLLSKYCTSSPYDFNEFFSAMKMLSKGKPFIDSEVKIIDIPDLSATQESKKMKQENNTSMVEACEKNITLLKALELENWYPAKISLQDVMKIRNDVPRNRMKLSDLPLVILKKLIMVNYTSRDKEISNWFEEKETEDDDLADTSDSSDIEDILKELSEEVSPKTIVSPLDIFVALFGCCDLMLKQALVQKMFMCRLAVPLIYPQLKESSFVLSLWALRTIVAEWRERGKNAVETNIATAPLKTISFARYGRPAISKSKHLNGILDTENHHTFFNKDSPLGDADKTISNGLVEVSWFIPSGKASDAFHEVVSFLNLRGDAENHERQLEVMSRMSNIVVIYVAGGFLVDPNFISKMKILYSSAKHVVVVLEATPEKKHLVDYKDKVETDNFKNTRFIVALSGKKEKNVEYFKNKLLNSFESFLHHKNAVNKPNMYQTGAEEFDKKSLISIEDLSKFAQKFGIYADEEEEECLEGKKMANQMIDIINRVPLHLCKKEMLPLQLESWQEWCKLLKKSRRPRRKKMFEEDKLTQGMKKIREDQIKKCLKLSDLVKEFVNILKQAEDEPKCVIICLQWLKIYLDNKSREILPQLHKNFYDNYSLYNKTNNKENKAALQTKLNESQTLLANSSFGLEHLFREIGQIYEALTESGKNVTKNTISAVERLPKMAAKLFLMGWPLELMDGEAGCVPMAWVKAVFQAIKDKIGDKKVFIISVLGIQSSGKSTMLNTMFGLQFAVSAGRCTRGIYLQMVKVDEECNYLPFDYVFVVDSEGLRANELGQTKHEHDNELATLVTGLGDVTVMNIKGENVTEMKDILQITVHAFLRMKLANQNIQLRKKCVFLHQNVSAVNAEEKLAHGRMEMRKSLDSMANEAAFQENISNVHAFNDVIDFDEQKHVWYVTDLWKGDPPMAPVNPGYSEQTLQVKENLLFELAKEQTSFLNISNVIAHFEDLWNGVLADDFVFSFKNSLAVKAYNEMESKYSKLVWDLEYHITTKVVDAAFIKISGTTNEHDLNQCYIQVEKNLLSEVTSKMTEMKEELKRFFDESSLNDILVQWESEKLKSLEIAGKSIISTQKQKILTKKEAHKIDILQMAKYGSHEEEIMRKSKALADKMKGKEIGDVELREIFDATWQVWMVEYGANKDETNFPISVIVDQILWEEFPNDHPILQKQLKHDVLTFQLGIKSLEGSIQEIDINQEIDFTMKLAWYNEVKNFFTKSEIKQCKARTVNIANSILARVDTFLHNLKTTNSNFDQIDVKKLIKIIITGVQEHNSIDKSFTLVAPFTIKLAVHACRFAIPMFDKMRQKYEKEHSIVAKMTKYRQKFWNLFKNVVKQSTEEVIAADLLCDHVEELAKSTVMATTKDKVVNEIMTHFANRKAPLLAAMLDDLAKKESFHNYMMYFENGKNFALDWIMNFTDMNIFNPEGGKMPRYIDLAKPHVISIVSSIKTAIQNASQTILSSNDCRPTVEKWTQTFLETVKEKLPLTNKDLTEFNKHNIADFQNLQRLLYQKLELKEKNIIDFLGKKSARDVKWEGETPYQLALDRLWGCEAACPFCREPCQRSDPNHGKDRSDSHQCIQHRPKGITGIHWEHNGKLVIDTCDYLIHTKTALFSCGACRNECRQTEHCNTKGDGRSYHAYGDYKKFLPHWDIFPNPKTDGNKYWMWFMNKYLGNLVNYYGQQTPDIPPSWKNISIEEALESLRIYN